VIKIMGSETNKERNTESSNILPRLLRVSVNEPYISYLGAFILRQISPVRSDYGHSFSLLTIMTLRLLGTLELKRK
jgi:hypothetical protein